MKKLNVVALALLSSIGTVHAAEFSIDSSHSNVMFTIRHFVSKVSGDFKDYSGTIVFDEKKLESSSIKAAIKTASINTSNEKRDEHLKSGDFFAADKNPEITFVSKKFKAAGKGKFKVDGELNMHGIAKPVTLDVEYLGAAKDMQGNTRAGFSATGKVNRKDFGISWNKALDAGGYVLGDDVTINLNVEGVQAGAQPAKK